MKTRAPLPRVAGSVWTVVFLLLLAPLLGPLRAAEPEQPKPADPEFESGLQELKAAPDRAERMRRAEQRLFKRALSSQQVKRLAKEIADEDERIEFAAAAFPHVVDPENFYDVYDSFQTFSKVFRLHDRLSALRRPGPPGDGPPVVVRPSPVGSEELAGILASLRKEPFDDAKLAKARLLDRGLRGRLTCQQAVQMLNLFSFDDNRLECAKLSVVWINDPGSIHLLVDAMKFLSSRDELTKFIEARKPQGPGRPAR
jgi:hypothetical protein